MYLQALKTGVRKAIEGHRLTFKPAPRYASRKNGAALIIVTALAVAAGLFVARVIRAPERQIGGAAGATAQMTAPESQLWAEVNADRAASGLPGLAANGVLAGLARQRSQQMAATGAFTHYAPDGSLVFQTMLNSVAFPYAAAGENLAQNNYPWGQSLDVANSQLMTSPEHRANILDPRYNEVGTGIAGPSASGLFYYTELFAQVLSPSPAIIPPPFLVPGAAAGASCQFVLGFNALRDMAALDIGSCLDDQASQANGDATQHTTRGLMVWRKADNWTAFTNGYVTWINGPLGLASRLNTDHFSWEAT